jgi:hypothetical protein
MEREAKAMSDQQVYRELVQNGFEAGAGEIILDGWTEPESGRLLARVSDSGSGMTHRQLVEHLSVIHNIGKGPHNYGVGARIAALPKNPAGVTFASRTKSQEGLVKLVKRGGIFGIEEWEVDVDGYEQLVEVVEADQDELERVKKTGTAVILHGSGRGDTWNASASYSGWRSNLPTRPNSQPRSSTPMGRASTAPGKS